MAILVTGGAGFIGSNFILDWFQHNQEPIINVDKLTYAGNLDNLREIKHHPHYHFIQADINECLRDLLQQHAVRAVVHFAAESHVDRSIAGPAAFVETNAVGTFRLLESVRDYWTALPAIARTVFRFVHISTDEVFGSLTHTEPAFTEASQYAPNSPYSASKAAADHFVRAYHHTYGLPTITVNCSNNYGPRQYPEKLIPLTIQRALAGQPIPIYGNGSQIRDWLYVCDHTQAIQQLLLHGRVGEVYTVGGLNEKTNLDVVHTLCALLDAACPRCDGVSYANQITFVDDRPGHDVRYAIDAGKLRRELGWQPAETFVSGLKKTLDWYVMHTDWVQQSSVFNAPLLHQHETV